MVTSKRKASVMANRLVHAAIAASIAAALSLAGCNRSGPGEASENASVASDRAARVTASAGEPRLKPDFAAQLKGKDPSEIEQTRQSVASAIKNDKENQHGVWKQYLDQKSVAADLDTAAEILKKSADSSEFTEPAMKSSVQAQLGATQLATARLHLSDAQQKLLELTEQVTQLQSTALYVNLLGAQAGAHETLAKGDQPADLSKLQSTLDQRKSAADQAQKAVDDIQNQMKDKQQQASKIYSDTDAAFAASEGMKGTASIDAARKAMDDRKQADELSEQAANLQPSLDEAMAKLQMAKIQEADAQSQLTSATSGNKQSDMRVQNANQQAKNLHDQAKELLGGDNGLDAKYKAFTELADSIKGDITKAASASSAAAQSYASAAQSEGKFISKLSDLNLPSDDPLMKGKANQNHLKAVLTLGQVAAKDEAGRTNLIAYIVGQLRSTAAKAMSQAYAAAGTPKDTGAEAADRDTDTAKTEALSNFDSAATTADSIATVAPEGSPEKWLAYTLKAVALHGKYLITHQPNDMKDFQAAAQAAQAQNPFLELSGLTPSPANAR
ncbi:MAG: hypothetical protein ACTHN5_04015 [Phycisphaerae bacterium]